MEAFLKYVAPALAQYVLPVLLTALIPLIGMALRALATKLEAEGKESKGKALAARLLFLTDLVVADLNATMKAEILAATADGVVTPEEGAKLKAEAMSRVKALLAKNGVKELEAALGILAPSLESLLSGLVESAVARSKVAASPK